MTEAIEALFMTIQPFVGFFDTLFSYFYSGGFYIFGLPFYMWILVLIVVGFFFDILTELVE